MGLILMRLIVAIHSITLGIIALAGTQAEPLSWVTVVFEILVGVALFLGLLTPLAGVFAAAVYLYTAVSYLFALGFNDYWQAIPPLDLSMISVALVLLGPGAFSLDARLFGRREIIIPPNLRPPSA